MRLLDVQVSFSDSFADVPVDSFGYEAVHVANELGIVKGVGSSRFNPKGRMLSFIQAQHCRALKLRLSFLIYLPS